MSAGASERLPGLLLALAVAATAALALANADPIRERAAAALERGMPSREAALAGGFVLGEDERIDSGTVEDFRRSGLAHLLAVSGQNVALLALLATPLLAAFGLPLRARLTWMLGLIAAYVVVAGAGPSIQRAGTMGALSILATLSGRRASKLYALAVAAIVTLAIDPGIAADVGWQLSFVAVLGILLFAAPARRAIVRRIGSGPWQRTLADGVAMTVTATVATAPLIVFHFGELSTTTLVANLLALPAVAPAMWLGMLAAAGGQVPGFPVEALNALNAPLLAYVAQVADWLGSPRWASLEVGLDGPHLAASYALIGAAVGLCRWLARRRRVPSADGPECPRGADIPARRRGFSALIAVLAALLAGAFLWTGEGDRGLPPLTSGLRVTVFDVGQGDAILIQTAGGEAVLVDGGPPGAGLAAKLRSAGVRRLDAVVLSHDQSDHAGGIGELVGEMPVGVLAYAVAGARTLAGVRAAGVPTRRLAAGGVLRAGRLSLEALWPPRALLAGTFAAGDPNRASLVLRLRWRRFAMLLPGDGEAEAVPLDPGPVDVLKVAHHGSEDAGLDRLLARATPSVAVVSAGNGNPFGHPTAATMTTLAAHGIRRFRTDRDGTVVIDVGREGFRVSAWG